MRYHVFCKSIYVCFWWVPLNKRKTDVLWSPRKCFCQDWVSRSGLLFSLITSELFIMNSDHKVKEPIVIILTLWDDYIKMFEGTHLNLVIIIYLAFQNCYSGLFAQKNYITLHPEPSYKLRSPISRDTDLTQLGR